jgi:hypothetical protein
MIEVFREDGIEGDMRLMVSSWFNSVSQHVHKLHRVSRHPHGLIESDSNCDTGEDDNTEGNDKSDGTGW